MFRSVAYMMLEIEAFDEAIALFRKVQDKAPAEPQSFIVRWTATIAIRRLVQCTHDRARTYRTSDWRCSSMHEPCGANRVAATLPSS